METAVPERPVLERRELPRASFAHPVTLGLIAPGRLPQAFKGCFKDVSRGGACVQFEQRVAPPGGQTLRTQRVKLEITHADHGSFFLFARIRWVQVDAPTRMSSVLIGLHFEELSESQERKLESFISLRRKDHNMLWALWDAYQRGRMA